MVLSQWLQIAGGGCELIGLGTVALGVSETRRTFTNRPSLVAKLTAPARRLIRRFRRRKTVVAAGASVIGVASMAARGVVKTNWEQLSLKEKVERLQSVADRHEDMISDLGARVDKETEERQAGDSREQREREEVRRTLEQRISDAAAGGLSLETVGVAFFALGVALSTWGSVIS